MATNNYGICRGGPHDGQWLASEHKQVTIAERAALPKIIDWDLAPPDFVEIKYGDYHYVLGQWIWRER